MYCILTAQGLNEQDFAFEIILLKFSRIMIPILYTHKCVAWICLYNMKVQYLFEYSVHLHVLLFSPSGFTCSALPCTGLVWHPCSAQLSVDVRPTHSWHETSWSARPQASMDVFVFIGCSLGSVFPLDPRHYSHFPVSSKVIGRLIEVKREPCEVKVVCFFSRQRGRLPGASPCQLSLSGMDVCH